MGEIPFDVPEPQESRPFFNGQCILYDTIHHSPLWTEPGSPMSVTRQARWCFHIFQALSVNRSGAIVN